VSLIMEIHRANSGLQSVSENDPPCRTSEVRHFFDEHDAVAVPAVGPADHKRSH
jgi:hypothetical protein